MLTGSPTQMRQHTQRIARYGRSRCPPSLRCVSASWSAVPDQLTKTCGLRRVPEAKQWYAITARTAALADCKRLWGTIRLDALDHRKPMQQQQ